MDENFAAFILSNSRADHVFTVGALSRHGYTGKIFVVIDDEDDQADAYRRRYGDDVLVFSKREIAERFDEGDNFKKRGAVFYARNACFDLAREAGVRFFIQLDDDYTGFYYRFDSEGYYGHWRIESLDWLFSRLSQLLSATPFSSIAISQGGDHIAGALAKPVNGTKRKAMNTFVCDTQKPFAFVGKVNEDVNTYTEGQRRGLLFLTIIAAQVNQMGTQSNEGGMTDLYLNSGTYIKSFYSVMYAPSCVKISHLRDPRSPGGDRLHHFVNWNATAPKIIREAHRKREAA